MAASSRPWPAISPPLTSMSRGLANPNCRMEAAISATCFFECVRAFLDSGLMLLHFGFESFATLSLLPGIISASRWQEAPRTA
jgi:hypothetical protein